MVIIYEFDRFMRLARIVLHGGVVNSTLKDCGDGINKMILKKHKYLSYRASGYAFVYFLSSTSAFFYNFQSHSFTILSDSTDDRKDPMMLIFYCKIYFS